MATTTVGSLTAADIVGLTLAFTYNEVERRVHVETATKIGDGDNTWGSHFLITGRDEARDNQYRSFKLFELEVANATVSRG